MKLYFILLVFLTLNVFGQAPIDTRFYLDNAQVSKNAKDFYHGKFRAADNIKTFSIIDSLTTKNNQTRPFYIYLVSTIINKSDGALSESLGVSCKTFIESQPDFLIDFLFSKNKLVDKTFIDNWANIIAEEFMIECEGEEKQCIKESLQFTLGKSRLDNKSRLISFYQKVESYSR